MAYTPEDSWQEFETTGSVAAYLAYRKKSSETPETAEEPSSSSGESPENQ